MKDSKGHGSNSRKGSVIPTRPYRAADDQSAASALRYSVKSVPTTPAPEFGKRTGGPELPAHQSGIVKLLSDFANSESGSGRVPEALHDFDIRHKGPSDTAETAHSLLAALVHSHDPSALLDFAKYLGFLAAIAITDIIVLGIFQ